MRVLNLSQPATPISLEVVYSEAAEMLMSMLAIGDLLGMAKDVDTYDIGRARLEALHDRAGDELMADIERLFGGPGTLGETCGRLLSNLFGLVLESDPPRDVDSFLRRLETSDPTETLLALVGYYTKHSLAAPRDVIRRAVRGDVDARTVFIEGALGRWGDKDGYVKALEHVVELGPEAVRDALVDVFRRWDVEVFSQYRDEARSVLQRDYKAKLGMAAEHSLERTIELATNGIQFTPEADISRVVLSPSYIAKPWVLVTEHRETAIYFCPVSDESLGIDDSVPPPQLVKLYRALGDANRLRLLQRIARGPTTLKEATELLGSAKSTAFHHLAILRQAGLVWVREEEDKTFTLREDLIPHAAELLQAYLRVGDGSERPRAVPGGRVIEGRA